MTPDQQDDNAALDTITELRAGPECEIGHKSGHQHPDADRGQEWPVTYFGLGTAETFLATPPEAHRVFKDPHRIDAFRIDANRGPGYRLRRLGVVGPNTNIKRLADVAAWLRGEGAGQLATWKERAAGGVVVVAVMVNQRRFDAGAYVRDLERQEDRRTGVTTSSGR